MVVIAFPALSCPECTASASVRWTSRRRGEKRQARTQNGVLRMGGRWADCRTCNAFAQAVIRATYAMLRTAHPEDYAAFRAQAEQDLWCQFMADWEAARSAEPSPEMVDLTALLPPADALGIAQVAGFRA